MKKKMAVIFSILGVLLIIFGIYIAHYTVKVKNSRDLKNKETTILNDYNKLTKKVEDFNNFRSGDYYNNVAKTLTDNEEETNYDKWITNVEKYTTLVDATVLTSENLKKLCINETYTNKDVDNACKSFIIAYETTINYYTKDILLFNKTIEQYYRITLVPKENIKVYTSKYDFTDINTDGNFVGKD